MASRRYTRHPAPMTQDEYRAHQARQAEERIKRGFTGFTRAKKREDVMGATRGESKISAIHRRSQSGKRPY